MSWRRPGRLLSPSTLSRPLSDYLHLRSVRHTARLLIRSPPLCSPPPPLPRALPLQLPRPRAEMARTRVFRNDRPQLGRGSVHLKPSLVALDSPPPFPPPPRGPAPSTLPPLSLVMLRRSPRSPGEVRQATLDPLPPGQDSSILILNVLEISFAQPGGEVGSWSHQSLGPSSVSGARPRVFSD